MGKYKEGFNGPFSGKVGKFVGSSAYGVNILRSLPKKRSQPFTPGEIQQQQKFKMMTRLLKPLGTLLNKSFNSVAVNMSGYNKAYSYNLKNSFQGTHPGLTINYSMIMLGRGDLPNVSSAQSVSSKSGWISFSWSNNEGTGISLGTDQVFIAAFCEKRNQWIYVINVAPRNEQHFDLNVVEMSGYTVHTYIGCMSANGADASDSFYTGQITVL